MLVMKQQVLSNSLEPVPFLSFVFLISSSALVSEDVVSPMVGSQLSLPDALFRNTWHPPEDASKKKKKKGKKGKGKGGKKSGKKKKK